MIFSPARRQPPRPLCLCLCALLEIDAFDRRHIGRVRQIRGHGIENRRDTHAVQRRTAQHRLNLQLQRGFANDLVNQRLGNRLLGQRQLHQLIAVVVERLEHPLAPELGFAGQILIGNFRRDDLGAFLALGERQQLHPHEIDDAAKRIRRVGRPLAHGNLQRDRHCAPSRLADFLEHGLEIGPFAIHLVDERQPRHFVLVGLPPNGFALGFDAFAGAEHHDAAIEHPQAAFDFGREIDVAGRIDQIDDDIFPRKLHAG